MVMIAKTTPEGSIEYTEGKTKDLKKGDLFFTREPHGDGPLMRCTSAPVYCEKHPRTGEPYYKVAASIAFDGKPL